MLHMKGENYVMRGETIGFANRQKSIFDQLDAVAVKQVLDEPQQQKGRKFKKTEYGKECTDVVDNTLLNNEEKLNTRHLKGKESIFKRPELPRPRCNQRIPDFQRNPHKWVKYSLSDVSQDDMSETSNTAAAMSFLNEMKARKHTSEDEKMETDVKITFKKPVRSTGVPSQVQVSKDASEEENTKYFRGSKLVMPEYVVGKKMGVKKQTPKKSDSDCGGKKKDKEIKLNHLTEYDDNSDDMEDN